MAQTLSRSLLELLFGIGLLAGCGGTQATTGKDAGTQSADLSPPMMYGNHAGDILADFSLPGYRLSPTQRDSSRLTWDPGIKLSDFHSMPSCMCLIIVLDASYTGSSQQEESQLPAVIAQNPSICVLDIVQEGGTPGRLATKSDVDDWTAMYMQDYWVVQGNATSNLLAANYGSPTGIPFHLIVRPTNFEVLGDAVQGVPTSLQQIATMRCATK